MRLILTPKEFQSLDRAVRRKLGFWHYPAVHYCLHETFGVDIGDIGEAVPLLEELHRIAEVDHGYDHVNDEPDYLAHLAEIFPNDPPYLQ